MNIKMNHTTRIKFFCLTAVSLVLMMAAASVSAITPGALDKSFSQDGMIATTCGPNTCFFNDMAVTGNGDIVTVGRIDMGGGGAAFNFLVQVRSADGVTLANQSIDIAGTVDQATSVDVSQDGKIVIAGFANPVGSTVGNFAIVRLNADFTLDTTFDGDGKVTTDFNGANDFATVVKTSGTEIYVGGNVVGPTSFDFGVARYTNTGALDTSFSGDGKASFDLGAGNANLTDITLTASIYLIGSFGGNFTIMRITSAGSLDPSFDTDGIVTTDFGGNDSAVKGHVLSFTQNRIMVAGNSDDKTAIAQYLSTGALSTSFDGDGKLIQDFVPGSSELLVGLEGAGTGYLLGIRVPGQGFRLTKIKSTGVIDVGFGHNNGSVRVSPNGAFNEDMLSMAINPGEKFYLCGNSGVNSISISAHTLQASPSQSNDFDGDGFSDTVIFRPSTANWFVQLSSNNQVLIQQFGASGDVPLDGDFDGDGKSDLAIFRPSVGEWWFQRSSDLTVRATQFGTATDKPVAKDIDKDGKTDLVFWRPSDGNYYVIRSSDNFASFFSFPFGANGDIPVGGADVP